MTMQFCKSGYAPATTAEAKKFENPVTYTADIAPLMSLKCTPCHFPEKGKKKFLDTYSAVQNNIEDIVNRVELPMEDEKFMPFKSKKEPLTEAEIQLLKDWIAQDMPK